MPTPTSRSKILPARGSKANLDAALAASDLLEGELCYAKDEDALYQVEEGVLVKVSGTSTECSGVTDGGNVDTGFAIPPRCTGGSCTGIADGGDVDAGLAVPPDCVTEGGAMDEAPLDGNYYVRQDGAWVNLETALAALGIIGPDDTLDGGDFTGG